MPALSACNCRRRGKSKPGGAFTGFIPKPASIARRRWSRARSGASPRSCAARDSDLSQVTLDLTDINPFQHRAYELTRAIPRGETRTYAEIAIRMRRGEFSVAQAIAKNPFMIIVPCHRVLEVGNYADKNSPFGGTISKRHLLSLEGTRPIASKTLFDVLLPVAAPRPLN